jgi:ABC-type multidrug transport system ATPase subunit
MKVLKMDESFATRYLNEGFSGGEKKRAEILQMALLEPTMAILDETDSGLDIDALRIVAEGVNTLFSQQPEMGVLVITHYQRLLNYIVPDKVHVLVDGRIVRSGVKELALELRVQGAPDEAGDAQAGDRRGVLEGEEHAEPGSLVGRQLQDITALPLDRAARNDVRRMAHQGVGEGRLARAVRAHDRVDLALAQVEVDALQDLRLRMAEWRDPEAPDQQAVRGGGLSRGGVSLGVSGQEIRLQSG